LTAAQHVLEECCFDFGRRLLPKILEDHGWDCAEAVELSIWTRILADASHLLSLHALEARGILLKDILSSACNLRNTAVHRLPTTARGISQFVQSALRLAETLQDNHRAAQLEELHHNIDSRIKAMELNKNVLEDTLNSQLQEIQRQREELDNKEKELIATMLKEDHENQSLIGSSLEESVRKIFEHRPEVANYLEKNQGSPEAKEDGENTNGDGGIFDNGADVEKA
jgi:DNA anti-recombination protein RmuC